MSTQDFKSFVDPDKVPRLNKAACKVSLFNYPPPLGRVLDLWGPLSLQPYKGVTSDGYVTENLYSLAPNGAGLEQAVNATHAWLASLDAITKEKVCLPIQAEEWRHWHNTPLVLRNSQVEFEVLNERQRRLGLEVLKASISERGYFRVREVMANNAFLGDINQLQEILNAWSFTLTIFGSPSLTEPWGWQFFGHHLALNCLFIGGQMVLSPAFLGLEPDIGHLNQRRTFEPHEEAALSLMRSLAGPEREQAVLYDSMLTADQPPGRFHPDDGRIRGGAFQDNRIIPYEGVRVGALGAAQRRQILSIAELFVDLPAGPAEARMKEIEAQLRQTYFAWIGKANDQDPFYFRIHSPVVLIEFDHHSGIFLSNKEPARFHVHTLVRTPNGNDYGTDLLRQHYALGGHSRLASDTPLGHSHDGGKTFHDHG